MILPTNGKVVVFDDVYNDVKGLLQTLSKNRIPYNYYQDEGGLDLPEAPIKNVRLIFLDIQLVSGQSLSSHNIISTVGNRFQKILEPNNNYVLVYWSTKKDKYQNDLEQAFENGLKEYKPILTISLNKAEALSKGNGIVDYITSQIEEESDNFNLFKVFALWENLVNDSAGNLINDFTNFIGKDKDWDESTKYVLYKLAQAYSGKTINNKTDIEKLKDSLFTLSYTLIDTIENSISNTIEEKKDLLIGVISDKQNGNEDYSSIINNKLLLSEMTFTGNIPGCLFLLEEELEYKKDNSKSDLDNVVSNKLIPQERRKDVVKKAENRHFDNIKRLENHLKAITKNFNIIVNSVINLSDSEERRKLRDSVLDESIKIELNISPLCDFAQEKMQCTRILPGLLLKSSFIDSLNKQNAYNYFSDCVIRFRKGDYYLLFDFRFLYSKPESLLKKRVSNNKLRHQLLSDIQLNLGSHINRSGVIYVK